MCSKELLEGKGKNDYLNSLGKGVISLVEGWDISENKLTDDFLTCCTEEADELVDMLLKVKNGDLMIIDVTKLAGNLIEIKFQSIEGKGI